jgi:glycosyltransferase involved in cell wall biosynthesis
VRVLFVTNSLDVGGIEINLVRLTRALTQRGHHVHVAAAPGALSADIAAAGATLTELRMSARQPHQLARDVRRLADLVREARPDVVHVFSAASAAAVQLSRPLWGRTAPSPPVVASVMGLHAAPGEADLAVRLRVLLTALGSVRLVVMAPAIDAVVRSVRVRRSKLVHQSVVGVELPEGEVPDDRTRLRRELGIPDDAAIVTTIGRLEPRKSHHLFVRAAAEVLRRTDLDVRFLVAGDGAEDQRLRDEMERLSVQEQVRLLGHRPDVYPLLRATDVCVRPGIVEGFIGITVLEAQALGVPVVSFDTEDVRLAVQHERTGLLVPAGDVSALADAVLRLVEDPTHAATLGRAGRDHVRRTYGMPAVVDALEQLYAGVVARRTTS